MVYSERNMQRMKGPWFLWYQARKNWPLTFMISLSEGVVIIDGNNLRYSLYRGTPGTHDSFTGEYDKVGWPRSFS